MHSYSIWSFVTIWESMCCWSKRSRIAKSCFGRHFGMRNTTILRCWKEGRNHVWRQRQDENVDKSVGPYSRRPRLVIINNLICHNDTCDSRNVIDDSRNGMWAHDIHYPTYFQWLVQPGISLADVELLATMNLALKSIPTTSAKIFGNSSWLLTWLSFVAEWFNTHR